MAFYNYSSLQLTTTAASTDRFILRNGSAAVGPAGFNQITAGNLERAFTIYSLVGSQSANNASVYSTVRANSATNWKELTLFNQISSTVSPNATIPVHGLSATGSPVNIDFAIIPKGNGALLAEIPDGLIADGNKRGPYATDWQRFRAAASQVASGNSSTIGGGYSNTASNDATTIAGGSTNTASAIQSTVGGGALNASSGIQSTICGGYDNRAVGEKSVISGGGFNVTTGDSAAIGGGRSLSATGDYSSIGGGNLNVANGLYSAIGGGLGNNATGNQTTIGGGQSNQAIGIYTTIGGGGSNQAVQQYATVAGGSLNVATQQYSTIGGGYNNKATQQSATVAGGFNNDTSTGQFAAIGGGSGNISPGYATTIGGGSSNTAAGDYSIASGFNSNSRLYGQFSQSAGVFSVNGDAQYVRFILRNSTTNNSSTLLFLDGAGQKITLQAGYTYSLNFKIIGTKNDGITISEYNKRAIVRNREGTLSAVRVDDIIAPYEGNINTDAAITIDATSVNVAVTGIAGETWRWVAVVDGIEMKYS